LRQKRRTRPCAQIEQAGYLRVRSAQLYFRKNALVGSIRGGKPDGKIRGALCIIGNGWSRKISGLVAFRKLRVGLHQTPPLDFFDFHLNGFHQVLRQAHLVSLSSILVFDGAAVGPGGRLRHRLAAHCLLQRCGDVVL